MYTLSFLDMNLQSNQVVHVLKHPKFPKFSVRPNIRLKDVSKGKLQNIQKMCVINSYLR